MMKHVIWQNADLDYSDWEEFFDEEYPDANIDERLDMMYEMNNDYLDVERLNLSIKMNNPILVIADLGLWDGNHSAYKEIRTGNIADCLYTECDYAEWYVDELGDLCCTGYHHDGTNHYTYRVYKDEATETQRENLKEKLYRGTATRRDITRITKRLGDEVAKVYGWKL